MRRSGKKDEEEQQVAKRQKGQLQPKGFFAKNLAPFQFIGADLQPIDFIVGGYCELFVPV